MHQILQGLLKGKRRMKIRMKRKNSSSSSMADPLWTWPPKLPDGTPLSQVLVFQPPQSRLPSIHQCPASISFWVSSCPSCPHMCRTTEIKKNYAWTECLKLKTDLLKEEFIRTYTQRAIFVIFFFHY